MTVFSMKAFEVRPVLVLRCKGAARLQLRGRGCLAEAEDARPQVSAIAVSTAAAGQSHQKYYHLVSLASANLKPRKQLIALTGPEACRGLDFLAFG